LPNKKDIYAALKRMKPKYVDINFFNVIMKDLIDKELIYPMTRNIPEDEFYATIITHMEKVF
jgi:hypothetical protein